MHINKVRTIIIAAALGLMALVIFQLIWMQHSRNLIEEDFEQKVKMALCSAMDCLNGNNKANGSSCAESGLSQTISAKANQLLSDPEKLLQDSSLHLALVNALNYYGIDMKYEVEIVDQVESCAKVSDPYCCSIAPTIQADNQLLRISFPERGKYVRNKMGFVFIASMLIIAFIALVFLLSIYSLLRMKKMNQISKDFFNNMAHEFKTPLTNIGLANAMLQKRNKELQGNRFLGIVDRENAKLKNQIERVLHLAKMENGEYQLQKEPVNINQLLQQLIGEMDMVIQKHQAQVKLIGTDTQLLIEADPFHLSNAFRNIIENALLYSDDQPNLTIEVKASSTGVQLLFSDNGVGIKKDEQRLIFEKFHRVGTGNLHQQKGFGLGLYYVKMVVELHKGIIKIVSEINKGSRFDLFLPIS